MAPISPTAENPSEEELDDILNGIIDGQDMFDTSNIVAQTQTQNQRKPETLDSGLGIDEEIKIVKKRQPVPKLDENRLLSAAGIPKLRRISKERLRFKGKGHEYGDIARMLNMYQLWLDDLYPRAKFTDGLAMIEKLGHTKRIQYMRKEWIDENKPRHTMSIDPEEDEIIVPVETVEDTIEQMDRLQEEQTAEDNEARTRDMDEPQPPVNDSSTNNHPDEDELDALLAEDATPSSLISKAQAPKIAIAKDDMFADEMEAMADMEGMW